MITILLIAYISENVHFHKYQYIAFIEIHSNLDWFYFDYFFHIIYCLYLWHLSMVDPGFSRARGRRDVRASRTKYSFACDMQIIIESLFIYSFIYSCEVHVKFVFICL